VDGEETGVAGVEGRSGWAQTARSSLAGCVVVGDTVGSWRTRTGTGDAKRHAAATTTAMSSSSGAHRESLTSARSGLRCL
jgi:hypothetical protein